MRSPIKYLRIENFALGSSPDGALRKDKLYTLRRLKNFYIDYESGRLVVRKGYTKWNAIELPAQSTQLYHFLDIDGNEKIIAISNNRWYVVSQTSAPSMIRDEVATAHRPVLTWEKRCLFGTDINVYWTDNYYIDTATKSFVLGIEKPEEPLIPTVQTAPGQMVKTFPHGIELNDTTHRKISFEIILTKKITTDKITLYLQTSPTQNTDKSISSVKVGLYKNSSESPSTELYDSLSQSNWVTLSMIPSSPNWVEFVLQGVTTLEAGTYWVTLEGSGNYYEKFISGLMSISAFYINVASPTNYIIKVYDHSSSTWGLFSGSEGIFYLGGLVVSYTFDYVYTYYNTQYGIESRPSMYLRTDTKQQGQVIELTAPASVDPQVDNYRIYRRILAANDQTNIDPSLVLDTYRFVASVAIGDSWQDQVSQSGLGAELQTADHYTIRDTDDTGQGLRSTGLIPYIWTVWKGRIWFVEEHKNILYMSKKLTEDGASGMTGDPIPDFFPLENKLELGYPYDVVALMPLQSNQLAIYYKNGSIWLLWGADSVKNPPDDYSLIEMAAVQGAVGVQGVCNIKGRHAYLSRNGIYVFNGTPDPEYISEGIQTILDGITDTSLAISVLISLGNELWCLLDTDNDGARDTVYILDLQRSIPTWRSYEYKDVLTDFVVRNAGETSRTILASSGMVDRYYLFELEDGQTDDSFPIDSMMEIHNLQLSNRIMIAEISLAAYYPSTPSIYQITLTDHAGSETKFTLNPKSSFDIRGHKSGLRGVSPVSLRTRVEQTSIDANELIAVNVGFIEK